MARNDGVTLTDEQRMYLEHLDSTAREVVLNANKEAEYWRQEYQKILTALGAIQKDLKDLEQRIKRGQVEDFSEILEVLKGSVHDYSNGT